jgi:hypothetical protein
MAIDRESRMVGNLVVKIEAAEPAVGEVQLDLLAQLPLEANAVAVTHDQHPDHQLGVDRRSADLAVERLQLLPKLGQNPRHGRIDAAQKMAFRDTLLEVEEVEQLALIDRLPTHHDPSPPKASTRRNHDSPAITNDFFNSIGQHKTCTAVAGEATHASLADAAQPFYEAGGPTPTGFAGPGTSWCRRSSHPRSHHWPVKNRAQSCMTCRRGSTRVLRW